MSNRVLIVDDDPVQRRLLKAAAERSGYETELFQDGRTALARLTDPAKTVDVVVLDLMMPDMGGLEVLEHMRTAGISVPVIVQTGQGGIETVVKAMRAGAFDFVVKPVSPERLGLSLSNALKTSRIGAVPKPSRKDAGFQNIVAASPAMERVISLGRRAAASVIPVVLEGESGVGKEMIAHAIQAESNRRNKPFVTVNCGAIPENLVESILFGHEKGAFTGATESHAGKFAEADGGTLFLDEIGELPPEIQVKLLRAVQLGEIETVGARLSKKVDIRLISATNKDLIAEVKAGRFREDLYYRLNVFPIHVPALRKRKEDIPQLVRHFAKRFSDVIGGNRLRSVAPDAMALLTAHDWPGNIRELENAMHRAIVLCDGETLTVDLFPQIAAQVPGYSLSVPDSAAEPRAWAELRSAVAAPLEQARAVDLATFDPAASPEHITPIGAGVPAVNAVTPEGEVRPIAEVEEELIRFALSFYRGQMSEVARRLGIGRSTLYRKLKDYAINPDDPDREAA
ncbi:response regulator with CheY-like receiver, AAA-type ATPase, and DNA-binding domains [Hoeflea sp. IMCC20628]|uniref:sigma-54-dependent transcriptional regulator n=1 Tax=Hoeflea sp. IMCC20628 TaxID=1620421 RepID=UPI00063AF7C5|nr:sigma-54 dependent transcriptional regulator [Hoeflea sp. IMCC20628]AKH99108.1 response regulator with CheY-like receiver, AAA-type ATPase, and DNA-binding domains [Hoeflea sp. IMCC20628]